MLLLHAELKIRMYTPHRIVKEEVSDDTTILPLFNGRIVSWVSVSECVCVCVTIIPTPLFSRLSQMMVLVQMSSQTRQAVDDCE